MWEWWCGEEVRERTEHRQQQQQQALLINRNSPDHDHDHDPTATIVSVAMALTSWLRSRRRGYFVLALCSLLLLPFLCATFPLLCVVEACLRLCRRRRRRRPKSTAPANGQGSDRLRRCEEGRAESGGDGELWLLKRYLEDQLLLVIGSVYDCGDDDGVIGDLFEEDDDGRGADFFDKRSPNFP